MKKRITAIILAVLMCFSTIGVFASSAATPITTTERYDEEIKIVSKMKLALENENMQLYIDEETAMIAVKNKKTGEIMLSNPYNLDEKTTAHRPYHAQVLIETKIVNATVPVVWDSYTKCIEYKDKNGMVQFEFDYSKDGSVIVKYDFGEKIRVWILPDYLSEAQYNDICTRIEAAGGNLKTFTRIYRIQKTGEWKDHYKMSAQSQTQKEAAENLLKNIGMTEEDIYKLYDEIGYKYVVQADPDPSVVVPLEYRLTNDGFIAEVDASKISYDRTRINVNNVSILPYFNSGSRDDVGYTFVPDGSGAIVRFEDVKRQNALNNMTFALYGNDSAFYALDARILEHATMPVFGLKIDEKPYESGFFAVIESAQAVASITRAHNAFFNSVYASFKVNASDSLVMNSTSTGISGSINVLGDTIFKEKCTVKYSMLVSDEYAKANNITNNYDTTYIGMAEYYRDQLMANGEISKLTGISGVKTKLFLEVFGSMKVEDKIATFPVTVNKALTTFDDIKTIRKELSDAGVGSMNFILTGFANGGLSAKYPTKVKWMSSVGGKSGFNDLVADAELNGYEVSPNFDFAYSSYLFGSDNINYRKYGSRSLDKRMAIKLTYDPGLQMLAYIGGIVISPSSYDYAYAKFAKSASKYNISNIAVPTLGSDLNSDFNEDNFTYRTESMVNTQNMLANLSGKANGSSTAYKLIVSKGNSYTLKYASYIINSSLDSSRLANESEAIPFMGIVLHGSKVYAGDALNMEGDANYAFLKALENGSNLYFTLAYDNVEYLKLNWDFSKYYSIRYDLWKDYIISRYNEYNSLMQSKQDQYITEHEFLNTSDSDGTYTVCRADNNGDLENSRIVRVEYENGEGFFLNYNADFAVKVVYNGVEMTIEPLNYVAYNDARI